MWLQGPALGLTRPKGSVTMEPAEAGAAGRRASSRSGPASQPCDWQLNTVERQGKTAGETTLRMPASFLQDSQVRRPDPQN